ncbi:MAG: PQQ-binding-like beta-propeller repeat protein [Deltaproteobacteria bacterium]|nr:PQQ-binding-like beta-propeller repeat protein [Deltaproteobacteria bacterium]
MSPLDRRALCWLPGLLLPAAFAAPVALSCHRAGDGLPPPRAPDRPAAAAVAAGAAAPAPAMAQPGAAAPPDGVILPRGGEDIIEKARAMSAAEWASPPAQFRAGHVTPRPLDPSAITKTGRGFAVQLPSRAPLTTPAVHQGLVLVSGGFRSKEFYAFRAEAGDLAWGISLDDDGPSTPACEEGVCVFNTESCTIFAVEVATGKMLWSWWLGDPLTSAPTIARGRVFASYPVPAGNAQQAASVQQNAVVAPGSAPPAPKPAQAPGSPPARAAAGKPRPPGASHALAAFDLRTGRVAWQRWLDADVMSAPVAYGKGLYAASFAGTLYVFDQADGTILAARAVRATSAPVITRNLVYYTQRRDDGGEAREAVAYCAAGPDSGGGGTYSKPAPYLNHTVQQASKYAYESAGLDAANGFAAGAPAAANAGVAAGLVGQANVSSMQAFQGSRLLSLGELNINTMGDEVVATDAQGRKRWATPLAGDVRKAGGSLAAAPIAAGGRILVGTLAGEVQALDPASGRRLTSYPVGSPIRAQLVAHRGWIYVGTIDGRLVAINTGDRGLTGWPTWGKDAARSGAM